MNPRFVFDIDPERRIFEGALNQFDVMVLSLIGEVFVKVDKVDIGDPIERIAVIERIPDGLGDRTRSDVIR